MQVQDNLRGPFLSEADDIDNSWFSLSLGGGENLAEPSPARSNLRTSLEQRSPIPQPRVTAHDDTHGRSGMSILAPHRIFELFLTWN